VAMVVNVWRDAVLVFFRLLALLALKSKRAFADIFGQFTPVIGTLALLQFFGEYFFRAWFADGRRCFSFDDFTALIISGRAHHPPTESHYANGHLFVYDLDLLVEHPAGEAVDRYVHPIPLFAIHDKAIREIRSIRWVPAALSDYIN
jgi:hypothetical protein